MSDDSGSRIVTGDADNTGANSEVNGTPTTYVDVPQSFPVQNAPRTSLPPLGIPPSDSNPVNTVLGEDNNVVPVQDPGDPVVNFRDPLAGTSSFPGSSVSLSGGSALAALSLMSNLQNIQHPTVLSNNNQTSGATHLQNPLFGASFGPVQSTNLRFNPNPTVSSSQVPQRTFGGFQYQASTSQGGFGYRNPLVPEPSSSSSGGTNTLATLPTIPGIPTTELSIMQRSNVQTSWNWASASSLSSSPPAGLFGTTMMPPSFGPVQSPNLGTEGILSSSQVPQRTFGGFQYQASTSQGGFGYRNPLVPEPSSSSSGGTNTLATLPTIPGIPTTELSIMQRNNVQTSWNWASASSLSSSPPAGLFGTTMMPPSFGPVQSPNLGTEGILSSSQVPQRTFGGFQYQASTSQGGFGYRNPLVPEPSSSSSGGTNTLATLPTIPGIPTTELSIMQRSNVQTSWNWASASSLSSSPPAGLFGTTMMPPSFGPVQSPNLGTEGILSSSQVPQRTFGGFQYQASTFREGFGYRNPLVPEPSSSSSGSWSSMNNNAATLPIIPGIPITELSILQRSNVLTSWNWASASSSSTARMFGTTMTPPRFNQPGNLGQPQEHHVVQASTYTSSPHSFAGAIQVPVAVSRPQLRQNSSINRIAAAVAAASSSRGKNVALEGPDEADSSWRRVRPRLAQTDDAEASPILRLLQGLGQPTVVLVNASGSSSVPQAEPHHVDHIRYQDIAEPAVGHNCRVCNRDLLNPPRPRGGGEAAEGPPIVVLPGSAVLGCGHVFHQSCLPQIMIPPGQAGNPPCIICEHAFNIFLWWLILKARDRGAQ